MNGLLLGSRVLSTRTAFLFGLVFVDGVTIDGVNFVVSAVAAVVKVTVIASTVKG